MEKQALDRLESTRHRDYLKSKNPHNTNSETHYYHQQTENKNQQLYEGSHTSIEPTDYGDDEDDDGNDEEEDQNKLRFDDMRYPDARMGICSVCHLSIRNNDVDPNDFEKALLCSDGHLLCYQCVQRFSIQSETNCVLCAATESQQSTSSISSNVNDNEIKRKTRPGSCRQRYAASAAVSYTDTALQYEMATNYSTDDNWGGSERETLNDEDEVEEKFPPDRKKDSNSLMTSQISSQMISECSRRPIQCPRFDCAVNVAFSALTNHFIFDHPEVPILNVDPGEMSTLIVNFDGLHYESSRCLALLLVSNKLTGSAARQFNGSHVHPRFRNRLPLPILAAKLYCNASYEGMHAAGEGNHEEGSDVIIAWIAGLDIGHTLRCSIQAIDSIDKEAFRSLTYTGPINSLRTAQKPREVFLLVTV